MAVLLKFLPLLVLAAWLYWSFTAGARTARLLRRISEPLRDWRLLEIGQIYGRLLGAPPFEVRVLTDMKQVNAVALATGEIYLSQGLYEKYLAQQASREEIAAVIAHEIGHVALGHAQRRIETSRAQVAVLAAVGFLIGRALFGWWAFLAAIGLSLANNRRSQQDEFEADAFAAQMMMRAGFDPRAAIRILEKVETWGGRPPDQPIPLRWIMTHPPVSERIAGLKQVIAAGRGGSAAPPLGAGPKPV